MTKRRFSPSLEAMEIRFTPSAGATAAVAAAVAPPAQASKMDDTGIGVNSDGTPMTPDYLYTDPDPSDYTNSTASYLLVD